MKSQSSLDIEINYPGQAICGLRIVREDVAGAGTEIDQKMSDMLKLKIRHPEGGFQQELSASVVGHFVQGIAYELPKQGLFQYVIELSTASGRALRSDLMRYWKVSRKSFVGLIAIPCVTP